MRVVERAAIGAGASGGIVGAMAPHVPDQWNSKKQFQLDSLLLAESWWHQAEVAGGSSAGYARSGRLQPLADDAAIDQARARAAGAQILWAGHADWQVIRATGSPWEPVSPSGWLIHDTLTARLHPRWALACLVAAIRARGGVVDIGADDRDFQGQVLWATGIAGLGELGQGGGVKGQALAVQHPLLAESPQIFADGVHIVPHADGTVAIGSTSERNWSDATTTDNQLDDLHARALALCPALQGAPVVDRWAALRPRSASRAPVLGPWPGRPGHYVANGGFKIGFGMAPRIATIMADLLLDGHDAIPDAFRLGQTTT